MFGNPTRLDLGGRGPRDMAWTGSEWILVAGASEGDRKGTRLLRWNGEGFPPAGLDLPGNQEPPHRSGRRPPPEKPVRRLLLCSDDSHRNPTEEASFRSLWVDLPAPTNAVPDR